MKYILLFIIISLSNCNYLDYEYNPIESDGYYLAETYLYELGNDEVSIIDSVGGVTHYPIHDNKIEYRTEIYYRDTNSMKVHRSVRFLYDSDLMRYTPRYDVIEHATYL